jgi:hypothetical protein
MPDISRRPRRRLGSDSSGDFATEAEVRAAVAAVRVQFATVAEAEASDAWRALRPRVTRWILRTARGLSPIRREDQAAAITRVYLRAPHFLPALPPRQITGGFPDDR